MLHTVRAVDGVQGLVRRIGKGKGLGQKRGWLRGIGYFIAGLYQTGSGILRQFFLPVPAAGEKKQRQEGRDHE